MPYKETEGSNPDSVLATQVFDAVDMLYHGPLPPTLVDYTGCLGLAGKCDVRPLSFLPLQFLHLEQEGPLPVVSLGLEHPQALLPTTLRRLVLVGDSILIDKPFT